MAHNQLVCNRLAEKPVKLSFSRLKSDAIPASSLVLMASLVPIIFCTLLAVIIAMFLFAAKSLSTEKRYLSLIDRTVGAEFMNGRGDGTGGGGRRS